MATPLLQVDNLHVKFKVRGWKRPDFHAVQGVSFDISAGETLGLVGESGSGKTTIGRAVLGLAAVSDGSIRFDGRDISRLPSSSRRELSDKIQVVFQDPYTSLNPSMTIGEILSEPLRVHGVTAVEAQHRIRGLLEAVHLPADSAQRYAGEFSGGQRQRVAIARSLALTPQLIVCDEPTSALDLSTQARVLDLLIELQERTGVAYLFISHALSVVRHISHRVAVLRRGEIVEMGDAQAVTLNPDHPYTQRLMLAAPVPDPARQAKRRAERRMHAASEAVAK